MKKQTKKQKTFNRDRINNMLKKKEMFALNYIDFIK